MNKVTPIERRLTRHMVPVAVLAAALIGLGPPAIYGWLAVAESQETASQWAHEAVSQVSPWVQQEPRLWRYGVGKRLRIEPSRQTHISAVKVLDCRGKELVQRGDETPSVLRATGWAPINQGGATVGWIYVEQDIDHHMLLMLELLAMTTLLGVSIGAAIYVYPRRIVASQARTLDRALRDLESAKTGLQESNLSLQSRVDEATEHVRSLSRRVVEVQEEERHRVSRDLHDSVGQLLTGLKFELQRLEREGATVTDALDITGEAVAEVRRVVHDLRPLELGNAPILAALHAVTERFERRFQIDVSFRTTGDVAQIPDALATPLFRVLQEALTNVAKHAEASEIGVRLNVEGDCCQLTIEDDGQGFDRSTIKATSMGLRGIRERTALVGGRFELRSEEGEGTTLKATFPFPVNTDPTSDNKGRKARDEV